MKLFNALLAALLFAAPVYADQALVLTEIEQIQEKIWYLQRDLAAQKTAMEKQRQDLVRRADEIDKRQLEREARMAGMAQTVARQQESLQALDSSVQSLKETVNNLANEFDQQTRTQLQQAEKSGTQEGLLRAMRDESTASRKQNEQALAEMREQLAETRAALAALKTNQGESYDRLILYGGGAALALMVLLTIGLAFRGGRSKRHEEKREFPTRHEL